MTPRIPVRTNNLDEWIRQVATVINLMTSRVDVSGEWDAILRAASGGGSDDGVDCAFLAAGVPVFDAADAAFPCITAHEAEEMICTVAVPFSLEDDKPAVPVLRLTPLASDPATLEDGDLWFNATAGKIRARVAGVTVDLN